MNTIAQAEQYFDGISYDKVRVGVYNPFLATKTFSGLSQF